MQVWSSKHKYKRNIAHGVPNASRRAFSDAEFDWMEIKTYSHTGGELDSPQAPHDSLLEVVQSIGKKI
jgi:hypothetical protein